jgi:glycosyltransferase involved in cell wall biosynthesis
MEAGHVKFLSGYGISAVRCKMVPTGMNPVVDLYNMFIMAGMLKKRSPDLILTNTVKPVIFGTFAAFLAGYPRRYALVSGLGYAFTDDGNAVSIKKKLVRWIISRLYKLSFRLNKSVIFQNQDDIDEMVEKGICTPGRARCVSGSGVDVDEYPFEPHNAKSPSFIMVARLLHEKGVMEYLEAARQAKSTLPEARFVLIGDVDDNPSAMPKSEIDAYVNDGTIEWPGAVEDVRGWLKSATIFVLPSYREGVPRSTLEAMSTGLAIITTDVPGCRETVEHGKNGLLVPVRNSQALAEAMMKLALDADMVRSMGLESRRLVERRFEVSKINREMCMHMELATMPEGGVEP